MTDSVPAPVSDIDLYSDEVLADPHDAYSTLRNAGPGGTADHLPDVGHRPVRRRAGRTRRRLRLLVGGRGGVADKTNALQRNPVDHLASGYTVHGCAVQGLARIDARALISSLLRRVDSIEPAGERVGHLNPMIRGLETLPLFVVPAKEG